MIYGVETRWELTAEDLKTYTGLQVQAVSPDGQTAAILLSTPEACSDVAVLKLGDRGPLLKTTRIVPRPSANERLGNPHFSAGVLYATAYTFDVNALDPPRRLVTVDQADLHLGVPAFPTPTAWVTLRVDSTGREVIWSGKGAEAGNIYISTIGKTDKRVLTTGSDVTNVSGL